MVAILFMLPFLYSVRPIDAYASVNYAIIGLDNGLPPVQIQIII